MLKTKIQGFTLAEVLITLVIIGVIAALTIPNLLQKYQEQATVKKVQKFYSTLLNSYNLTMKNNGAVEDWGLTGYNSESAEKIYEILFKPHFKIAKDCGVNNNGECIINARYKGLNGNLYLNFSSDTGFYKITLEDGSSVTMYAVNSKNLVIFYDTNGIKEPNQLGKDTFGFLIFNKYLFPDGMPSGPYSYAAESFKNTCNSTTKTGQGCAAWVVYKGNMDYLHCDGLKWTSRSCKEK